MKVPFLDLKTQYESIREEINEALEGVFEKTAFAGGPFVEKFEEEFAAYCGTKYAIGVGSGTEALWLALLAIGVGPGDEVITVPNTFIATAEAISFCGAKPVFVDVLEDTYNIDPQQIEAMITERTKAIIPVHLFGQMADMDLVMEIAKKYGLFVIEDAAQSHGAVYKGRKAGSIGDVGCFSFYPGKNLGAYGEAGAVVTDNPEIDRKIRMLRDHGQSRKYKHDFIGWNGRMDGIQAAVLSVKLKYLDEYNKSRRVVADLYNDLLGDAEGIVTPVEADYGTHVYHLYVIRVKKRDQLIEALREKGIYCGIHYPVPIHLQDAYGFLGYEKGSFPVAESSAEEFVSLPIYPEISVKQIEYTADAVKRLLLAFV